MFTCNWLTLHTIFPLAKLQVVSIACRLCSLAKQRTSYTTLDYSRALNKAACFML